MRTCIALLLLLLLSVATWNVVGAEPQCGGLIGKLRQIIKTGEYKKARDLHTYLDYFGNEFSEKVTALGPDSHWMDMGSGNAKAVLEYQNGAELHHPEEIHESRNDLTLTTLNAKSKSKKAAITAVSYEGKMITTLRFQHLTGRYLEDIPVNELTESFGKADLITDVFGVLSYSPSVDIILQKYLAVLKPNGSIYHFFGSVMNQPKIITKDGKLLTLSEWLGGIKGLRVSMKASENSGKSGESSIVYFIKIETDGNTDVSIPELELMVGDNMLPPRRIYREKDVTLPEGEWTLQYPNGAVKLKANIKNGKLHGEWQMWHPNGEIMEDGYFNKNKFEGEWRFQDSRGRLVTRATYKNGKLPYY